MIILKRPCFLAGLCCWAGLAGCLVHKPAPIVSPTVPTAGRFHQAAAQIASVDQPSQPWWQAFEDRSLDALIRESLEANLDLQRLAARIDRANALLRQARGRLFPALDGSGSYDIRRTDSNGRSGSNTEDSSELGVVLSWELDVWGRLRSARAAQAAEARATVQDWLGGRLLLSASVAETYFEIQEQRQQLRLIHEQIEVNGTLLELTKLRFGQSLSSIVDVLQQREQLAATRARVPELEARLEQLGYALEVLLGRAPAEGLNIAEGELKAPAPLPAAGLPSDLLERRPDLLAARDFVRALDHRVGEAIAGRLPRFVLGGSGTALGNPGFETLVSGAFGSVAAPLFDAGIRRAEVARRRAELREALAAYSQSYLTAVQEVETGLVRERKQGERVELLEAQLDTAQQLLRETRNRYSQGLTDYLPVLNALVTVQNLQRDLLTSRRSWLSFRVALHRALGGPMVLLPLGESFSCAAP